MAGHLSVFLVLGLVLSALSHVTHHGGIKVVVESFKQQQQATLAQSQHSDINSVPVAPNSLQALSAPPNTHVVSFKAVSATTAAPASLAVSKKSSTQKPQRYAYVTLLNSDDDYVKGCVVLGRSLGASGTVHSRVLLAVRDLSPASTRALEEIGGWQIKRVQHIPTPFPDKCWRFCDMYAKLRVWEALVEYDLAVYLDSDMLVTRNIDFLFHTYKSLHDDEIAAVADLGAPHINGGMFVFKPSQATFNDMLTKLGKIEHAVIRHPYSISYAYEYTEQSFIHAYFRPCLLTETCSSPSSLPSSGSTGVRLRLLPAKFNCQLHTPACRAEFEDNSGGDVAVFHYTAAPKPWSCGDGMSCCDTDRGSWSTDACKQKDMCSSKTYTRAFDAWARTWRTRQTASYATQGTLHAPPATIATTPNVAASIKAVQTPLTHTTKPQDASQAKAAIAATIASDVTEHNQQNKIAIEKDISATTIDAIKPSGSKQDEITKAKPDVTVTTSDNNNNKINTDFAQSQFPPTIVSGKTHSDQQPTTLNAHHGNEAQTTEKQDMKGGGVSGTQGAVVSEGPMSTSAASSAVPIPPDSAVFDALGGPVHKLA